MLEKEEKPVGVIPHPGYVGDELLFDTTPRTKSAKGMKQISPMAKITTTSTRKNGAVVKNGCNSKKMINPMNNILAWKSSPRPVTYPNSLRRQSSTPPMTQAGVIKKSAVCRASSVSAIGV